MLIVFGFSDDPVNVVNKTYQTIGQVNVKLKRDFDLHSPSLRLTDIRELLENSNYAFFPELGRYYFIDNLTILSNELVEISLVCDYLNTFKDQILTSTASYRTTIRDGLMGSVSLDYTGLESVEIIKSDVELVPSDNSILSVLRWG